MNVCCFNSPFVRRKLIARMFLSAECDVTTYMFTFHEPVHWLRDWEYKLWHPDNTKAPSPHGTRCTTLLIGSDTEWKCEKIGVNRFNIEWVALLARLLLLTIIIIIELAFDTEIHNHHSFDIDVIAKWAKSKPKWSHSEFKRELFIAKKQKIGAEILVSHLILWTRRTTSWCRCVEPASSV